MNVFTKLRAMLLAQSIEDALCSLLNHRIYEVLFVKAKIKHFCCWFGGRKSVIYITVWFNMIRKRISNQRTLVTVCQHFPIIYLDTGLHHSQCGISEAVVSKAVLISRLVDLSFSSLDSNNGPDLPL